MLENVREHSRTRRNSHYTLRNTSRLLCSIVIPGSGVTEVNPEVRLDVRSQRRSFPFGGVAGLNPVGCRNIASLYVAELSCGRSVMVS